MNLYIRIVDGQPVDHPILEDNLLQILPDIDLNNLPPNYARFERVECPLVGRFEVYEGSSYGWVDGVVKDIHTTRDMTVEEKNNAIQQIKDEWQNGDRSLEYPSWVFDDEKCIFVPPVTYPADGGLFDTAYAWNEENQQWELREEIAVWNEETQSYDVIYPDPA